MGLGRLPGPRLYVVRQTGLFSRRRSIEFGEDGRGLLRVSFEICVLYAVWSLAPTYFMGSVVSYAAEGSDASAGSLNVPGHAFGDDHVHPAQYRSGQCCFGLVIGQWVLSRVLRCR